MSAAQVSSLALVPRSTPQWLTASQVMEIMGWSQRTFFRRQAELISREASSRSANGRTTREYLASSLPNAQEAQSHLTVAAPPVSQLGPLFAGIPMVSQDRVALTDPAAQQQADERYHILEPILDYPKNPGRYAQLRLADGRPVTSLERMIIYAAVNCQQSPRTIKRWLAQFRTGGFSALADRIRADKGVSRWATQSVEHTELANLAAYAYLNEHLNKRMAWEIVECRARQLQVKPPSYETIRTYLEELPPAVKTLALKGRSKYDELFAPYIRRGYTDFEAGEILVSDHAWHDVLVQNDIFDAKDRQHMRLRFTGLQDMRSRKFVAYTWSQDGSSRSINTCLRHSLETYGTFREFYCDNGKDYRKVGKGARSDEREELQPEALGVLARLGCTVTYCQPFHGQSKLIESANHIIHQRFDRRWKTYTGPTPEQRPDRCIAALERHKKLLAEGRADESDLPLASEFIRAAALWIENEYNVRPKNVPGMEGLTPNEAFEKFRWAKAAPAPEPHILAALLAERTLRIVHECAIKMDNRRYIGVDEDSQRALHNRTGEQIIVAYDPLDLESLAAIDEDGCVFAYLEPETFLRQAKDAETQDAIGASMQERRHRYHETRDQLDALSRSVLSTGYMPQHNQMLQIGRLPIDISQLAVHRPQSSTKLQPTTPTQAPVTPAQAARLFMEEINK
ncbi:MAG: helix-turn-helix domain-containing protein [Terracidiphilus sp.]|nr:helix-turn-helix domain-containing protein [Terracidiphilus sp.]